MSDEEAFDIDEFEDTIEEDDDTDAWDGDDGYEPYYDTSICGKPDTFSYYDNCFR